MGYKTRNRKTGPFVKLITNKLDVKGALSYAVFSTRSWRFSDEWPPIQISKEGVAIFYPGIDIDNRIHVVSVIDNTGKILLKGFTFPNNLEGEYSLSTRLHTIIDKPFTYGNRG